MDQTPRSVSVIIPSFNCESTIARCLTAVLHQSHRAAEVLVYDDGSSDDTQNIVTKFSFHHSEVKLFKGHTNRGAGYARDVLLQHCRGGFIAFVDADDYWHPDKIGRQLSAFKDPAVGICVTDFEIRGENGQRIGTRCITHQITLRSMLVSNWIGMSTAMVRASLMYAREMPFLRKRQDYAYWLRLLRHNRDIRVVNIPQILVYYERRKRSVSSNKIDNIRWNYKVFRSALDANMLTAALLVMLNIVGRLTQR